MDCFTLTGRACTVGRGNSGQYYELKRVTRSNFTGSRDFFFLKHFVSTDPGETIIYCMQKKLNTALIKGTQLWKLQQSPWITL